MGTVLRSVVLDCPDPRALAAFYRDLLDWRVVDDEPEWAKVQSPDGGTALAFQPEPLFVAPAWPGRAGAPLMMAHLDIAVDDLIAGVSRAVSLGARLADVQPQDDVRVLLDPVGHPFCLFVIPEASA